MAQASAKDAGKDSGKDSAKEEAAAAAPSLSTFKMIAIVAVTSLLTATLGAGGAVMLLGGSHDEPVADAAAADEPEEAADDKPSKKEKDKHASKDKAESERGEAIYIDLKPAFVVNFQDAGGRSKFLKAEVNAVTRDSEVAEALEKHMPVVRNSLVLLFSRQVYEDLVPNEGKEKLRSEALRAVQDVIEKETGSEEGVEEVLFTSFVIQ
jgi:flagellar FliL protein